MEQKQLQVAHPGDESSKVGESIFYMIVLLSILPTISGLISDFFRTQYLREIEVSVLGMTGYIETVLTAMTAMLGIGAQAVISKDVGARNIHEARRNYTSIVLVGICALVIVSLMVGFFRYPLASTLLAGDDGDPAAVTEVTSPEEEALADAYDEGEVRELTAIAILGFAVSTPISGIYDILIVLLHLEKRTRRGVVYAALMSFMGALAGLILVTLTGPSLLRYELAMSIGGNVLPVGFMLWYKRRRTEYFRMQPKLFSWKRFFRIFRVGLPGGLEYFWYAAYQFVLNWIVVNRFSYIYMASFELKEDLSGGAEVLLVGMCLLLVERFGMTVGSGNKERLRREIKYSWIACVGISVLGAVGLYFLYPVMVELFMGDNGPNTAEIVRHARYFLTCSCIGLPFYVANNLFTSVYEVQELLKHVHLNYFLETFGFITLYSVILCNAVGLTGLWIAYPLAEASALLVNFILLCVHNRRLPKDWLDLSFSPKEKEASVL